MEKRVKEEGCKTWMDRRRRVGRGGGREDIEG